MTITAQTLDRLISHYQDPITNEAPQGINPSRPFDSLSIAFAGSDMKALLHSKFIALMQAIALQNVRIDEFILIKFDLSAEELNELCAAFSSNHVYDLHLHGCNLNDSMIDAIIEMLRANTRIGYLRMIDNPELTDSAITKLTQAFLKKPPTLKMLFLTGYATLDTDALEALRMALKGKRITLSKDICATVKQLDSPNCDTLRAFKHTLEGDATVDFDTLEQLYKLLKKEGVLDYRTEMKLLAALNGNCELSLSAPVSALPHRQRSLFSHRRRRSKSTPERPKPDIKAASTGCFGKLFRRHTDTDQPKRADNTSDTTHPPLRRQRSNTFPAVETHFDPTGDIQPAPDETTSTIIFDQV